MPNVMATCPLAESTSTFGRKNGDTRSAPRSRITSDWSRSPTAPPIAEPGRTPRPAGVAAAPLCRGDGEQHVPREPSSLLRRHDAGRIEVLHLRGDAHGELRRV